MDKDNVFWLVFWMIVAIVLICGFHGCRKMYEAQCQHDEAMADRGYECFSGVWVKR